MARFPVVLRGKGLLHNGLFTNCYPFCYLRGILRLNDTNGEMNDARRVQFPDLSGRYEMSADQSRIYQARWFLSSLATEMMSSLFPPRTTAFGSRNLRQERSRWARTGPRRMPILGRSRPDRFGAGHADSSRPFVGDTTAEVACGTPAGLCVDLSELH